jgi:hypothetical protein
MKDFGKGMSWDVCVIESRVTFIRYFGMEVNFGMWIQELKTQHQNKRGYGWMESTHYWSLSL